MSSPRDKVEDALQSLEEYFYSSVAYFSHSLPDVHDVANKLWIDISRYGPGLPAFPEVHIPSLGDFQVPPPPPPVPQPEPGLSVWQWTKSHPRTTTAVVVGVLGTGLLVGYRVASSRPKPRITSSAQSQERRQVVVVLGGDTPYGLPLIQDLERKGYIVIASVATPEAVEAVESRSRGYVKALVLDPSEPSSVPAFLRSLSSTLSRKFPLRSSGDPYSSPASQPYIQSIISLLTLPSASPALTPTPGPLEHISLLTSYLPHLTATQVTPLQVIQQLLPLLRTGSARSKDKGQKSIIVCLPAVDTHVALPFKAVEAMSAAGTLRAVEILRREVKMAAVSGKTDVMKNIRVVTVDVGEIELGTAKSQAQAENAETLKSTENWTSSEKLVYGPAFASVVGCQAGTSGVWDAFKGLFDERRHYSVGRNPTRMSSFVRTVVSVVSEGRYSSTPLGQRVGLGRITNWMAGDRVSVGAGANTYKLASYLPSLLLDGLLNLPYFLIGLRNRLLPVNPHRIPPPNLPPASRVRQERVSPRHVARILPAPEARVRVTEVVDSEDDNVAGQEGDVEEELEVRSEPDTDFSSQASNAGANASVESSWINLDGRSQQE